jgi:hypothetical protein
MPIGDGQICHERRERVHTIARPSDGVDGRPGQWRPHVLLCGLTELALAMYVCSMHCEL